MHVNLDARGQLVVFFALAFAFGWIFYLLPLFGLGEGSNNPFAPVMAAAIVLALTRGRQGLRLWLDHCVRWRAPAGWYVLALGVSPVVLPLAAVLAVGLGAMPPSAAALSEWIFLPIGFAVMFVLVGIGEEWGWTGFALPELAALGPWVWQVGILAVLRTLWHAPLLLSADLTLPIFLVIIGAQYLWATAYRRSGAVVMVVACWHASLNSVGGEFLSPLFTGTDAMTFSSLWVLGYVAITAAVLIRYRGDFRRSPEPAEPAANTRRP